MKGISILGSTGSIGAQTLDVVRRHPDRFRVVGLAAGANVDLLLEQIREFRPRVVALADERSAMEVKQRLTNYEGSLWLDHSGPGIERVATADYAELVVSALPGSAGLQPTFAAVQGGRDVALATKEVLVMAGRMFMETVARKAVRLLPIDSEQSAIFQCLEGNIHRGRRRIILTASGGPFRDMSADAMAQVVPEQALAHPRWKMGRKVTVDSATLMNKGLEVIEARWLFFCEPESIEVVIHPQSICHSMVEFEDGSIMAQLGATDMRIPISFALAYPDRVDAGVEPLSFPALGSLTFLEPDWVRFPLLKAAYQALEDESGAACVVLNAADEVAVELFLNNQIGFADIARLVLSALDACDRVPLDSLQSVVAFHEHTTATIRATWPQWLA
jgi:1-deoxy-D-xylulose-5-phosphate reductoisomerase